MKFAERRARDYLIENVPRFDLSMRVSEARSALFKKAKLYESVRYIYILDNDVLVGVLSIKELLQVDGRKKLSEFCGRNLVRVLPDTVLRIVVARAMKANIGAVPVINRAGEFLGIVGEDVVVDVLNSVHIGHILHHSGLVIENENRVMDVIKARVFELFRVRAPWILFGLAGGILATLLVDRKSVV